MSERGNSGQKRLLRRLAYHFLCGLVAVSSICSLAQESNVTISGLVRDSSSKPLSGAVVQLERDGHVIQSASSDPQGMYRLNAKESLRYIVRAKKDGYETAVSDSFVLAASEDKRLDVTLKTNPGKATAERVAMPEFSDEPNFTVAGIVDPTNLGGHGSDTIVRNREAVAKTAASLNKETHNNCDSSAAKELLAQETTAREALNKDAESYKTNLRLAKILLTEGKPVDGLQYFEKASRLKPAEYEPQFGIALAHCAAGDLQPAKSEVDELLKKRDVAELHHLLAEIEEKQAKPLEAVREYERAAELEPNETNLFDWGAELLLHQAPEPAIEVFSKGVQRFPRSARLLAGLGAAQYVHGQSDEAVASLCRASDLDPLAEQPYLLLGKIQKAEPDANAEIAARLTRFMELRPNDARANYYYAVSLWRRRNNVDQSAAQGAETFLKNAVHIDPSYAEAYMLLGVAYSEEGRWAAAIAAFQHTTQLAPGLPEAHYRLAQAYRQNGDNEKVREEMQRYSEATKKSNEEAAAERHAIGQFVYTMRGQTAR